jgi:hypothetical protein
MMIEIIGNKITGATQIGIIIDKCHDEIVIEGNIFTETSVKSDSN